MNDSPNEQIFDSLLEEMLTNQHPPDLTEVIQQRLRQELGPERFQQLRSGQFSAMPQVQLNAPVEESAQSTRNLWKTLAAVAATLAAGFVLAVGLWNMWPADLSDGQGFAQNKATSAPAVASSNKQKLDSSNTASVTKPKTPIDLPLDSLPFSQSHKAPELPVDRSADSQPIAKLSDTEIVAWMNQQFDELWQANQVGQWTSERNEEVLARVNHLLADSNSPVSGQSVSEMADKLVRTATFAETWSAKVADLWLSGSAFSSGKDASALALRKYLAAQIVARKPWNQVLAELIGSPADRPQSAVLVGLAGGDNHRLAGRLGSLLLDEALACARCHDASDNGRVITTDQDQYWSLVAIFSGIDVDRPKDGDRRVLVDRQLQLFENGKSPNVFFDRPDGRLQAAHYRLPGGDNWRTLEGARTPRESLAKWIATTPVTDQASVNMAWRIVFGRPLVAQHSALDGDGLAQRREVLKKLAEQFRAHDRDMGQLVSWLVSSRPFASQTLSFDRSRWVNTKDDEVNKWNQAVTNFAVFPAKHGGADSLDRALAMVNTWAGIADDRRAMLAQLAAPSSETPSPKSAPKAVEAEPPVGYLVRALGPNSAQQVFINRLTNSKLSWSQQVDHIAGLVGEPSGNAHLHSEAQKLLDSKNGDRSAALFLLLQSALICN